jgi:pSer/pThr/pTyr-binding forkhead associated (FHA) protein
VLDNIAPVTDKRRHGVSTFLRKGEEGNEVHWVVSAETGPLSGLSYAIQEPILLGRALECDLAVVSPHISRQHAKLEVIDGHLHIEDLGSSNGTMINGKRASGQHQLRHDDELRFHDIIFRVTENLSRPHSERQASDQTTFIQAAELEKHN